MTISGYFRPSGNLLRGPFCTVSSIERYTWGSSTTRITVPKCIFSDLTHLFLVEILGPGRPSSGRHRWDHCSNTVTHIHKTSNGVGILITNQNTHMKILPISPSSSVFHFVNQNCVYFEHNSGFTLGPSFGLLSVWGSPHCLVFSHYLQGFGLLGNLQNAPIPRFLHNVCNIHRLGHSNAFAIWKFLGKYWRGF